MNRADAGFYLHTSNRSEHLLAQLAAVIETRPLSTLSEPEIFVVQSQGMERVITRELARSFSVFCNFTFFFPLHFFLHIGELLGIGVTPDGYDRDLLSWRLNALLAECDGDEYAPLHRFLNADEGGRRRFQLACRLADNFDQYQVMRSDMVLGWERGRPGSGGHVATERWQLALWNRLKEQLQSGTHRAALFQRLLNHLDGDPGCAQLPQRVSIFGVHTLPPLFVNCLSSLSRWSDVHLYLLAPCRHYWGDQRGQKRVLRAALTSGIAPVDADGGHPLLADLGRQGREFQELMLDEVEFTLEIPSWHDPFDDAKTDQRSPTLLERLQHDLLEGSVTPGRFAADDSLRIQATHSRWRELQVLHDHLRRLLEEDPDLNLRDIVVMAPDIQHYAGLIPAAFSDIPFSIADRSLRLRNPAIAAFSHFLGLFGDGHSARFGRSEVLELLNFELVAARFDLSETEVEEVCRRAEEAGIRWGLSAAQRAASAGIDFAEGTFAAGLDRLLMGVMIDSDSAVDGIFPATAFEGRGAAALGGLCELLAVVSAAEQQFRTGCSLGEWSQRLVQSMDALLAGDDSSGIGELRALLTALPESEAFCGEQEVDFAVICDWFARCSTETRSSSGFLRGQLTFCSMLPMRSIPFQVVCLLGLDDGVFPGTERADTFDLIAASPRPGDRSPRNDDRYQFLEALLAARRVLYLSYVGLSEKDGGSLPPSVVVAELLDLLARSYGVEGLVVEHPLSAFSERCFDRSDSRLFSCSRTAFAVARARRAAQEASLSPAKAVPAEQGPWGWWQGECAGGRGEEERVEVCELFSFFKNPQKFFVRRVLGLLADVGGPYSADREPFAVDALKRWQAHHQLFQTLQEKGDEEELLCRLQAEAGWPLGTAGRQAFAEVSATVAEYLSRVQALGLGSPCSGVIDLEPAATTADLAVSGLLPGTFERGGLLLQFGTLRGSDLLHCALLARLRLAAGLTGGSFLLAADADLCFAGDDNGPRLADLLNLWRKGCRRPLTALVEPAFAWAKAIATAGANGDTAGTRAREKAQAKAAAVLKRAVDSGFEAELTLLLGDHRYERLLDDEFYRFGEEIMLPLCREGLRGRR